MKDSYSIPAEKHGVEEKAVAQDLGRELGAMLVESSPDAFIALAPDHTISFWSTGRKRSSSTQGKRQWVAPYMNWWSLVAEGCEIVRAVASKKQIKLRQEIDGELSSIEADARSLKQILYNYLSNAVKFTPEEGVVTVRAKPDGAAHYRIEVEDTGIAIKSEDLSRLFVEFQQLDAAAPRSIPARVWGWR
jgi:hypothetical protein